MNETDRVRAIITGIQTKYPKIYEALSALAKGLDKLDTNLEEVRSEINAIPETGLAIAPNVLIFSYELTRRNVILRWEQPDLSIFQYEIRIGGTNWNDSTHLLRTATLSAVFDPLPVGTTRYWIKGIDFDGNESTDALALDVNVPALGGIVVTATVIDNNVLLSWTKADSTFDIDFYEVRKNGVLVGEHSGTFAILFETVSGTYEYSVRAVDIAGNISPEATVIVDVRQPPDFDLVAQGIDDLSGTKVNTIIVNGKLLANVNLTETWTDHFVNNGWTTIQQQIDAGFPLYYQPSPTTGSYEKVFDFGAAFDDVIINLIWNQNQISGSTTVSSTIATSLDNVSYTTPVAGRSLFTTSARYVKVKITFTGVSGAALVEFSDLIVALNVKAEVDSGQVNADKDDVGGTIVLFNKAFKDVNSITITADSIEPIYPIYDFVDISNPTQFKVLIYDSSGQRVDYLISWKARGIT